MQGTKSSQLKIGLKPNDKICLVVCDIAETDAEVTAAQEEPVSQLRS